MSRKRQKVTYIGKEPDHIDRAIAILLIENPNITDEEIGIRIDLCRQTVNRRRLGDGVKTVVGEMTSIPKSEIKRVVSKAFKKLESLIDDVDPRIALQASLNLLKLGVDLREELKGSSGRLMGLTPSEEMQRTIELEIEADKVMTIQKLRYKQLDEHLSDFLRDAIAKEDI